MNIAPPRFPGNQLVAPPAVGQKSRVREGLPFPLGASWDGLGVNFALFSAHATAVELCIFDSSGRRELERLPLPEFTDEVWHGYLPDARPGLIYGYRVHGPYAPEAGHRFNPNKLLLDPYARQIVGRLEWNDALFGYTIGSPDLDLSFDDRDSAPFMLKSRVVDPSFTWAGDRRPRTAWDKTVLYELHVRGYTKRHPAVPEELRGTLAGLMHHEVVDYIRSIGVTAIELLPVHAFIDDRHLVERGQRNYWGYNSVGFFAPNPRYLASPVIDEFKEAICHFHDAGIEVILDVVYNHTAEGNELGPTLSFKGIDNASYYRLADDRRYYINDTGSGNTVNLSHSRILQLVADSLRYWVEEMHVDGFRFDLATILAREPHGFDQGGGFLQVCRQDPVLSQVKLIAEPWDCGPGGYHVGDFSPGWAEWNDRFRDTVRAFWRGDEGKRAELASRLTASGDLFNKRGRKPWASVNFICAHDGLTLNDLVSYNDKHNEANGDDGRDGHSHNLSWNHGAEGATDDPGIRSLRFRQMRNLLATLMFSQGTPMLMAGDEFARTQNGNNNAYVQDNETGWIDWEGIDAEQSGLVDFTRRLMAIRREHPILRRGRFLLGVHNADLDIKDITWLSAGGSEMTEDEWNDPSGRFLGVILDGRAQPTGIRKKGADRTLLLLLNADHEDMSFRLPAVTGGIAWRILVDTDRTDASPSAPFDSAYALRARALVLLELATS